jgi:xanthine dehydrogenase accessory factor
MSAGDIYEAIVQLRREGRRGALATIVKVKGSTPSEQASKMLVGEEGILHGTVGGGCVEADVFQAAKEVMASGLPQTLTFDLHENPRYDTGLVCGGSLEIFVEPLLPTPVVYVFGAGHVGLAVYRVARLAGFDVVVADDRDAFANRERFPEAREVHAEPMETLLGRLAPPPHACVVIVTRGHKDDQRVLRWAAGTAAGYVGMLGSRRKVITILRALEQEGVDAARLAKVHAPIGLDLGATTPEEIGVAIVAELIGLRRGTARALPHLRSTLRKAAGTAAAAEPAAATAG